MWRAFVVVVASAFVVVFAFAFLLVIPTLSEAEGERTCFLPLFARVTKTRSFISPLAIYQTAVVVFTTNVVDVPTEVVDSDAWT